jgi:hypothetical protein
MLREVDGCLKCTFSHLITLQDENGSPGINKYCQQYLQSITTTKKVPYSIFETRLFKLTFKGKGKCLNVVSLLRILLIVCYPFS